MAKSKAKKPTQSTKPARAANTSPWVKTAPKAVVSKKETRYYPAEVVEHPPQSNERCAREMEMRGTLSALLDSRRRRPVRISCSIVGSSRPGWETAHSSNPRGRSDALTTRGSDRGSHSRPSLCRMSRRSSVTTTTLPRSPSSGRTLSLALSSSSSLATSRDSVLCS